MQCLGETLSCIQLRIHSLWNVSQYYNIQHVYLCAQFAMNLGIHLSTDKPELDIICDLT